MFFSPFYVYFPLFPSTHPFIFLLFLLLFLIPSSSSFFIIIVKKDCMVGTGHHKNGDIVLLFLKYCDLQSEGNLKRIDLHLPTISVLLK